MPFDRWGIVEIHPTQLTWQELSTYASKLYIGCASYSITQKHRIPLKAFCRLQRCLFWFQSCFNSPLPRYFRRFSFGVHLQMCQVQTEYGHIRDVVYTHHIAQRDLSTVDAIVIYLFFIGAFVRYNLFYVILWICLSFVLDALRYNEDTFRMKNRIK